jgi:hypothetical protein
LVVRPKLSVRVVQLTLEFPIEPFVEVLPKLSVRVLVLTRSLPILPVVVVLPKLSVRVLVFTRSLPIVPVVVVLPKLSVREVVLTLWPSQYPVVVVLPKLSVRVVVLQLACADVGKAIKTNEVNEATRETTVNIRRRMSKQYSQDNQLSTSRSTTYGQSSNDHSCPRASNLALREITDISLLEPNLSVSCSF